MITKLLALLSLVLSGPEPEKLPLGAVYIPPAKSGKGAKVVIPKTPRIKFLPKVPIDTPPEFFFPPLPRDPKVTPVPDTLFYTVEVTTQ